MRDVCVKIGLDRCPWCSLPDLKSRSSDYCWIRSKKDTIDCVDVLSRTKLVSLLSDAMNYDRRSTMYVCNVYYMIGTIKHYYPDKADMIDKLLLLIS